MIAVAVLVALAVVTTFLLDEKTVISMGILEYSIPISVMQHIDLGIDFTTRIENG